MMEFYKLMLVLNKPHAFDGLPCQDINATCKRTPAKRMRDYRSRKKIYLQLTSDSSSVVHHQVDEILQADDNLNKSHEFVGIPCQDTNATHKRTTAELMRDYRKKFTFNRLVILLQLFIIKKMKIY
ncbi:hypothetical protein TNCT_699621 [Trichonephila clavata]|uniref:Uncharacterized protein n=1 Tax=Trichonephila clavata TaxID=2740835 RepID=A0A8X6LVX6_TRICU|nr:hypothetical protein TNCT_699621 [Trichonephila clavata]